MGIVPAFIAAIIRGVLRTNTRVASMLYFWKTPSSGAIHKGAMRGLIVEWPMVSLVAPRAAVGAKLATATVSVRSLTNRMNHSVAVVLRRQEVQVSMRCSNDRLRWLRSTGE